MPSVTLPARQIRANDPFDSGAVAIAQAADFDIRLASPDWDDPSLAGTELTIVIDASTDGGASWFERCRTIVRVGSHGRDGALPALGCYLPAGHARATVTTTATLRLGATVRW